MRVGSISRSPAPVAAYAPGMRSPLVVALGALVSLLAASLVAHAEEPSTPAPSGIRVKAVVSIPPLKGLVAPLLPEGSEVVVLCPPGRSEHGFELTPGMVAALGEADLVVLVGMGLEPQVERAVGAGAPSAPGRRVVRFAAAVGIHSESHEGHTHAPGEAHDHGGADPHLWLDPVLAGKLAAALSDELLDMFRERGGLTAQQTAEFKMRRSSLFKKVQAVEAEYAVALEPYKGASIVTHHNAFGRLASRFGLVVAATIRATESGEPTPGSIAEVVRLVKERKIGAIFDEPQSDPAIVRRIAQTAGVRALTLDPLGDGDWAGLMRTNLQALVDGLASATPTP